ncbi:MAG: DUF131 domain-containing protein [Candidatus Thermoplasmatota archaeon]|nr:DUF131 domain-containing protein [Candidatus Thermoplasmatota archaeon]
MDKRNIIPAAFLLSGILLIILSLIEGEAKIALFFIIPIIYGTGLYLGLGILLIFVSIPLFFFFSGHHRMRDKKEFTRGEQTQKESSYGGVIFIGPIPIIFGKDKTVAKKMMYLGLLIALILAAVYVAVILI